MPLRERRERKDLGWKKEYMRVREKKKLEEHTQRKEDHHKKELEI